LRHGIECAIKARSLSGCALIRVKAADRFFPTLALSIWERAMPVETAVVITIIVAVFAVFALALAWADFYTRGVRRK
jgi:multisubunit Na+/H+ antiporter MnhC subunit